MEKRKLFETHLTELAKILDESVERVEIAWIDECLPRFKYKHSTATILYNNGYIQEFNCDCNSLRATASTVLSHV